MTSNWTATIDNADSPNNDIKIIVYVNDNDQHEDDTLAIPGNFASYYAAIDTTAAATNNSYMVGGTYIINLLGTEQTFVDISTNFSGNILNMDIFEGSITATPQINPTEENITTGPFNTITYSASLNSTPYTLGGSGESIEDLCSNYVYLYKLTRSTSDASALEWELNTEKLLTDGDSSFNMFEKPVPIDCSYLQSNTNKLFNDYTGLWFNAWYTYTGYFRNIITGEEAIDIYNVRTSWPPPIDFSDTTQDTQVSKSYSWSITPATGSATLPYYTFTYLETNLYDSCYGVIATFSSQEVEISTTQITLNYNYTDVVDVSYSLFYPGIDLSVCVISFDNSINAQVDGEPGYMSAIIPNLADDIPTISFHLYPFRNHESYSSADVYIDSYGNNLSNNDAYTKIYIDNTGIFGTDDNYPIDLYIYDRGMIVYDSSSAGPCMTVQNYEEVKTITLGVYNFDNANIFLKSASNNPSNILLSESYEMHFLQLA